MIYSSTFLPFLLSSPFLLNLNTILFVTQGGVEAAATTESEEDYYYEEEEEPYKPLRIVFRPQKHLYLHPARRRNLKKEYRTLGRGISKQTEQQRDRLNINSDEIEVEKEVVERVMEGRELNEKEEEEEKEDWELVSGGKKKKKKRKKKKKKRMLEEEVNGIVARRYLDQTNPVSNTNSTTHKNHHKRTKQRGKSQKYGNTIHKQQQQQQHSKTKSKPNIPITQQQQQEHPDLMVEKTGNNNNTTTSMEQAREIEISNDIKTNPDDTSQTNPQKDKNVPSQANSTTTTTTDTINDKSSTTNQQPQPQPQPLDNQPDDSNPQNNNSQTTNTNTDENEDDGLPETILFGFMICLIVFTLAMLRKKWKNHNSYRYDRIGSGGGGGSVADDDLTYGVSTVGGNGGSGFKGGGVFQNRQESVPLTPADNDDEWGWEDGSASGQIELGNHTTSFSSPSSPRTTTSGLQKTLDRSLSDARQKQRRLGAAGGGGGALRRTSGGSAGGGSVGVVGPSLSQQQRTPLKKVGVKDSWDDDDVEGGWGGDEGEVGRILAEQKKSGIPTITSLGGLSSGSGGGGGGGVARKSNAISKKKKEEPEDIFASMGLTSMGGVGASTGSFDGKGTVPVSSVRRAVQTKPETWKNSGLSNEGDGEGGGSDWDDDLDDLLDD